MIVQANLSINGIVGSQRDNALEQDIMEQVQKIHCVLHETANNHKLGNAADRMQLEWDFWLERPQLIFISQSFHSLIDGALGNE